MSVSIIRFPRSASSEHAANCSLNASSDIPTQFNASARTPVTCPTLAVSLLASMSPSIGNESPNVPITPAAMCDQYAMSSPLVASCASSCDASVARSVSPSTLYSSEYAYWASDALRPAVSYAVSSLPCATRYSAVADSNERNAPAAAVAAVVMRPMPFAATLPAVESPLLSFDPSDSPDFATPSTPASYSDVSSETFANSSNRFMCHRQSA